MKQEERLEILKKVVTGMAKVMGSDTEVVLHDLIRGEAIFIVNGQVTGRSAGYKMNRTVEDAILRLVDTDDQLIGYGSRVSGGRKIRASHFVFRDEEGTPCAMICINEDTSKLEEMRNYIDDRIRLHSLDEKESQRGEDSEPEEIGLNYIQEVTQQTILNAIEQMKPTDISTKEGKMEMLRILRLRGVFSVKDAVPYVCSVLSISQATLYNYLREIRNAEAMEPGNVLKTK